MCFFFSFLSSLVRFLSAGTAAQRLQRKREIILVPRVDEVNYRSAHEVHAEIIISVRGRTGSEQTQFAYEQRRRAGGTIESVRGVKGKVKVKNGSETRKRERMESPEV